MKSKRGDKQKKTAVKIYSTPICPWCYKVKEFLKENNVDFEDLNVLENIGAREEMIKKSGKMSVPITEINGEIIDGFDQLALRKALNL